MKPDILNLSANKLKTQFLTSVVIKQQNENFRPNLIAINIYFFKVAPVNEIPESLNFLLLNSKPKA
jgi:hypothetical protein